MGFKKLFKILKRALRRSFRLKIKHRRKKKKVYRKKLKIRYKRYKKRSKSRVKIRKKKKKKKIIKRKKSRARLKKGSKKPPKKSVPKRKTVEAREIGDITHYFPKVNAAVVQLKDKISIGDAIWIKGSTTDFKQTVGSLQIDRKPIEKAGRGKEIGLEVFKEVRVGDKVYTPKSTI